MTLKPNLELLDYKDILKDELCIDERALQSFVTLVRTMPYGYHEACRVLHHLLKDHLETEWSSSASKWVHTSCTEAIEAIKNPNDWTKGSSQAYPAKGKCPGRVRVEVARVQRVPLDPGATMSLPLERRWGKRALEFIARIPMSL